MGIKVIDRHGGPLLPGAVIARNLTREIEYFLPLGSADARARRGARPGSPSAWGSGAALHLAAAVQPAAAAGRRPDRGDDGRGAAAPAASGRSRRASGALRLRRAPIAVLWRLRAPGTGGTAAARRRQGCRAAAPRGGGQDLPQDRLDRSRCRDTEVEQFLRDFYAAERAFLEREQLYGRPKASKEDTEKPASGG